MFLKDLLMSQIWAVKVRVASKFTIGFNFTKPDGKITSIHVVKLIPGPLESSVSSNQGKR